MRSLHLGKREYQVGEDGTIIRLPFSYVMPTGGIAIKRAKILKPYSTKSGYLRVSIQDRLLFVHRIVYMAYFGNIPDELFIDHINGNRKDNAPSNLRLVTKQENAMNRQGPNRNNKSGVRGVYFHVRSGKWAFIVRGKQRLWTNCKETAVAASVAFHGK